MTHDPRTWACLLSLIGALAFAQTAHAERLAVLEFSGDGRADDAVLGRLADRVRLAALKELDPAEWEIITRENMLDWPVRHERERVGVGVGLEG